MGITTFNKPACKMIGERVPAALDALAKELGVTFAYAGGSIGSSSFTLKLEVKTADPDALDAAARREFNNYCSLYGLEPTDYGVEFEIPGRGRYRLVGFAVSRSKYPIRCLNLAKCEVSVWTRDIVRFVIAARGAHAATTSRIATAGSYQAAF